MQRDELHRDLTRCIRQSSADLAELLIECHSDLAPCRMLTPCSRNTGASLAPEGTLTLANPLNLKSDDSDESHALYRKKPLHLDRGSVLGRSTSLADTRSDVHADVLVVDQSPPPITLRLLQQRSRLIPPPHQSAGR
uniref:Uncharacterized protein n=1 Tax=Neobodo designis TaxID=312471 RepID=A0A7S1Q025_NEODS